MGAYILKADIENVFGADNVAVWSNLSGGDTADEARITLAISNAEEDVENRFRNGRYLLPFTPVALTVKDWCARIAGIWLFDNRPGYGKSEEELDGLELLRTQLEISIDAYTSGQRKLNCTLASELGGNSDAPNVVL
ncbi:unnamed protein product [marine sediment metagenome]|uniref:Uncharacterized protein n=1 Tax=marine sediment metagenome TaxID=412755 RepID=X0ZIF3_9ZZZZ